MPFEHALEAARTRFAHNGRFTLHPDESINDVVKREGVPTGKRIYVIFGGDNAERPLYIGKSGTVNQDGSWKGQTLRKRMTMKQGGISRRHFFGSLMSEEFNAGLTFQWFVTHNETVKTIPALAELELLQAHFEQFDCLPKLNRCA